MPHAEVDGHRLHYVRRGSGPPLLLIQGMSGNHLHWGDAFLDALAADFDVAAYDHRGVGLSDPIDTSVPLTIAGLAHDALGLLDVLGWERAHVMGISMGGMIAQELVLAAPQRVQGLVLGCTYPGGPGASLTSQAVMGRLAAAMTSGDRALAIRTSFDVNVSPQFAADPANVAAFEQIALSHPAAVPVIMAQAQACMGHDAQDRLGAITAPTLVLHGTGDQMLDVANGRLIASKIPDARLVELDGAGHMFWFERPEESAALVRDHLLAVTPGQPAPA